MRAFTQTGLRLGLYPRTIQTLGWWQWGTCMPWRFRGILFEDPWMFHYCCSSIWCSIGYWFPTTKNLQAYFMGKHLNCDLYFLLKRMDLKGSTTPIVLPYCWWKQTPRPTTWEMYKTLNIIMGYLRYQLVQDFFHQLQDHFQNLFHFNQHFPSELLLFLLWLVNLPPEIAGLVKGVLPIGFPK